MRSSTTKLVGGVAAVVAAVAFGATGATASAAVEAPRSTPPAVDQEGLVNLNLTGVTAQLPIALAANLCDVEVAALVSELEDGSAPCNASSNSDAAVTTEDGGPVSQDGLVNVNVSDVVVQAPISVVANVCDVTVAVLVSRLVDGASPCDATGTAEAITPVPGSTPTEAPPVDQEGLVNVNLTGVTIQVPVALAADVCDVEVAVLVDDLSDGSAPCESSADSGAMVTTPDGGPVEQDGLVNVNITDLVVQLPVSLAANICDVTVAVLVSGLDDGASPCDATATADAITAIPGEDLTAALPAVAASLPVDDVVESLPVDEVTESLPVDDVSASLPVDEVTASLPVTLPTD
jgi:hypothetical protein